MSSYDGSSYDVWNGFALSSNISTEDLGWDYSNQFGVFASSASIFAIGYAPVSPPTAHADVPTIEFAEPVPVSPMAVAYASTVAFSAHTTPTAGGQ